MFERFTASARQVVVLAQEEAARLGHGHIGTEHLLLGLLRTENGVAARALRESGFEAGAVRAAVQRIVGPSRPGHDDAAALRAVGIDLTAVRASVEESFGPGALESALRLPPRARWRARRRCSVRPGRPPLTPRSKKVLELALRHSLELHHRHIGPEHVLLALLAEGRGLACRVLVEGGARLPDISKRTLTLLGRAA